MHHDKHEILDQNEWRMEWSLLFYSQLRHHFGHLIYKSYPANMYELGIYHHATVEKKQGTIWRYSIMAN